MRKPFLTRLIPLALIAALLVGCSGKTNTPAPQEAPTVQAPAEPAAPAPQTPPTEPVPPEAPAAPVEKEMPAPKEGELTFHFFSNLKTLEEGQLYWGDCTLITLPDGENLMVDTGSARVGDDMVEQMQAEGVTQIKSVIITHLHEDHYGSLLKYIEPFGIETVYINVIEREVTLPWNTSADALIGYIATLEAAGVEVLPVLAGDQLVFGDVAVDILFPSVDTQANSTNDTSLAFTVSWKGQKAFFASDLYYTGETIILKEVDNSLMDADLMKIMHHGDEKSGGAEIIETVSPSVAVSMGGQALTNIGKYRYTKRGCDVYECWQVGDVIVTMDGENLTVWTQK